MEKEMVNNNGKWPIDYLRDRKSRGELEALLQKNFPAWVMKGMLDFLEINNYMVVKKILVVPTRSY